MWIAGLSRVLNIAMIARGAMLQRHSGSVGVVAERISVVGLGKLGAPLAAGLAHKVFDVCGTDRKPQFVAALRKRRAPVAEPGLADLLARAPVRATDDIRAAVTHGDVTFVVVPTPSTPNGTFSHAAVIAVVREIG